MIKQIKKSDLLYCLEVFHRGYETVAIEFGLNEENCPDRERSTLPFENHIVNLPVNLMNGTLHLTQK